MSIYDRLNAALQEICDNYCKMPCNIKEQDTLDNVCAECPMVALLEELEREENGG